MQSIFPFEKNRYFPYKRMRSADFSRELEYMDHKFQFLNRCMFGAGIASGLQVQRLEEASLLVSPGMAVDRQGRCLIVDEPAVCRIQTLKGFDDLQEETALLWLAYQEVPQGEVQLVPGEEKDRQEYTINVEKTDFVLTDFTAQPQDAVDAVLYAEDELYAGPMLRVRQVLPNVISSRDAVQLHLILENLALEPLDVKLHYAPVLPGFHLEGKENILLNEALNLPTGVTTIVLTLLPDTTAKSVPFTLSDFKIELNGREIVLHHPIERELKVSDGDAVQVMEQRLRGLSAQELWGEDDTSGVPIAGIRFIRQDDKVLLDDVIPLYHTQEAAVPAIEQRLLECRRFFPQPDSVPVQVDYPVQKVKSQEQDIKHYMTTGVITMSAGLHLRHGKILRTGEITHKLGPGTVYIDFGLENTAPDEDEKERNVTELLLGDASLFTSGKEKNEHDFDRGVRIHPDKGTFEMALRTKGDLKEVSLQLRWFAWKPEAGKPASEEDSTLLRLEPDVSYAEPGKVIHFAPVFHGINKPCEFYVEEKQDGIVTQDGVYTTPDRDGLYQVFAQVQNRPETRVSAFVIVRSQEEGGDDGAEDI